MHVAAAEHTAESVVLPGEQDERVPVLVDRLRRSQLEVRHDDREIHEAPALHLQRLGVFRVLRVAPRERVRDDAQVVVHDRDPDIVVVPQIG